MACDTLDTWLDAVAQVCDLRCLFFSNAIVRVYGHGDEIYQWLKCTSILLLQIVVVGECPVYFFRVQEQLLSVRSCFGH